MREKQDDVRKIEADVRVDFSFPGWRGRSLFPVIALAKLV
jgi:hypothetical protein